MACVVCHNLNARRLIVDRLEKQGSCMSYQSRHFSLPTRKRSHEIQLVGLLLPKTVA